MNPTESTPAQSADTAQYWREQCEWAQEQLSVERKVAAKLSEELREALAAVKVLARLLWNKG